MKIRLAKKIMSQRPPACGGSDVKKTMYYWHWRWLEWYNTNHPVISYKPCGLILDHRIVKAICLTERWNRRKVRNEAKKLLHINPFNPKDLARGSKKLESYVCK